MLTYSSKNSHFAGFAPPRLRSPQDAAPLPESVSSDSPLSESLAENSPLEAPDERNSRLPELESTPAPQESQNGPQVLVVRGASELSPWLRAWQELADAASEPNVFFEPWMLLPALETFAPSSAPEFHLIFVPGRGPNSDKPQLCGLFPLVRERRYKGVRTPVLKIWKHLYCPLGTPLLRRGREAETLHALLDFLQTRRGSATLLEMGCVSGDGPFGRALVEVFDARGTTTFVDECWTRAMMRPLAGQDGEAYLKGVMTGKRRKEFRRKEHRLADEGEVQYTRLETETDPDAALETYIAEFLRLEVSGWKGEAGSAFACNPAHQEFFRTIVSAAHARKRLCISTLRVGGHAVASKCDFLAGTGAYAFKIGFDEEFARFSPGVLLEMEVIRRIHCESKLRWMDSCAVRNHPMINRLWKERRTLQTLVIATGRGRGEFIVAGMSLLRHFKRVARRSQTRKIVGPSAH